MLRRSRGTPTERRGDRAATRNVRTPATATRFSARYLPRWLTLIRKGDQRSSVRTGPMELHHFAGESSTCRADYGGGRTRIRQVASTLWGPAGLEPRSSRSWLLVKAQANSGGDPGGQRTASRAERLPAPESEARRVEGSPAK